MQKEKLVSLNKWLIILLVLIQPFINIIKRNIVKDIQLFGFSIFELINIFLILISLFITIYLYKDKKHLKKFLLIIPIFIIYCIVHYINLTHFNLSVYENANPNFLKESYYLFRVFMVPLILIISLYYSNIKKDSLIRIVEMYAFIISIVIVLCNIFLIAHPSYGDNSFISKSIFSWFTFKNTYFYDYYYITSVGLFDSANQISSIMFMISPIVMYQAYKKRNLYNYILLLLVSVSMLMLGTKVASIGILLVYLAFIFTFFFFKMQRNIHHSIKPIILIFIFTCVLFCYSPLSYNLRFYLDGDKALSNIQRNSNNNNNKDKERKEVFQLYNNINNYDCDNLSKNEKQNVEKLYKEYNSYLGISKFITKNYLVNKHVEFWCKYTQNYNGTDYRSLKSSIYKNIYLQNNNNMDKWLGMGYTTYMIYTESDYSYQFYSYGIVGIIVLLGFYFLCIFYLLFKFLFNYKKNCNFENLMYLMGPVLAVSIAYFSGHVFESSIALITLSLLISLNMINFKDKKEYKKKVMFISSTGGHLNELMQLKNTFAKYDYRVVTEKTKSTLCLKEKYNRRINYLVYGTKDHKFVYPFKFIYNCFKSLFIFLVFNPKVIITTGTHTAVPMCYIGKFFGSKIIYIETFANSKTKTLTGILVYPIADTFIVQWESMLELYPKAIYGGWIY